MHRLPWRGARKIFQDHGSDDKAEGTVKSGGLALSWPLLGALSVFLLGVVIWAFFMGYMVGQGQNPNSKIQEITGISISSKEADKAKPEPEESQEKSPVPAEKVLEENSTPMENSKSEPAFRKPKGEELAAWGEASKTVSAKPLKKDTPPVTQKERLFDFSFQIAAFKNKAEAENLQKKLASISVKTKIQKSGKVQILVTNIRGPANTPEKLRQKLIPLKLGKPLQLSKKELSAGTKRNR